MIFLIWGAILALMVVPQFWAKHIMNKFSKNLPELPGTGEQLITHLKKKYKVAGLNLVESIEGDFFDPLTNTIHLTQKNFTGRSLTAVAVATHEFSHALQHADGSSLLRLRSLCAKTIGHIHKFFDFLLVGGLFIAFINPAITKLVFVAWLFSRFLGIIIHLVTLPVELDASYNRALPILKDYLGAEHMSKVRHILTACAYTYLAASLAAFWAIIFILRRKPF